MSYGHFPTRNGLKLSKVSKLFWLFPKAKLFKVSILAHFQWETGHNSLKQSWITIKSKHFPSNFFDLSVLLNYLQCPIIKLFFISCFSIGELPRRLGALGIRIGTGSVFQPFIFIFGQCVLYLQEVLNIKISVVEALVLKTDVLSNLLELQSLKTCYKIANESRTPKLARLDEREFLSINNQH